jgi:DNA end-binding protein Ku
VDIRKITPQTATEMQIVEFVRFAEIDPVYLETSYYMTPDEADEKGYALLFQAMRDSGYAAVAQLAMHRREHVMILRPGRTGIVTHTMFYPDEVRTIEEFRTDVSTVTTKELGLAKMLIETLAAPFDPSKFKDAYRERLQELIAAKAEGKEVAPAIAQPKSKVVDIMEALQKSLAAAQQERAPRKTVESERAPSRRRERRARS